MKTEKKLKLVHAGGAWYLQDENGLNVACYVDPKWILWFRDRGVEVME